MQAAIECCIDIASHLVSTYALEQPAAQRDLFQVLARMGYLDADYAGIMADMVALRNRLVHLYWDVDVDRVYTFLHTDIPYLQRFHDFALQLLSAEEDQADAED